eukprot:Skav215938  [mRNA]  locus=scaffold226:576212:582509:+ [translate_table: standard]
MGSWFSRPERRLLMIGPEYAGKTTLLYHFKVGQDVQAVPTVGYNVEAVKFQNTRVTVYDFGGKDRIMRLGNIYADRTADGLIFVVDSAALTGGALTEVIEQLNGSLVQWNTKKVLLILANKQDLPGAMDPAEVGNALKLSELPSAWRHHAGLVEKAAAKEGFTKLAQAEARTGASQAPAMERELHLGRPVSELSADTFAAMERPTAARGKVIRAVGEGQGERHCVVSERQRRSLALLGGLKQWKVIL